MLYMLESIVLRLHRLGCIFHLMVSLSTTSCFEYENENLLKFLFLVMMAKEKPPITVVGDVGGRIAIIVVRYTFLIIVEYLLYYWHQINATIRHCWSFSWPKLRWRLYKCASLMCQFISNNVSLHTYYTLQQFIGHMMGVCGIKQANQFFKH